MSASSVRPSTTRDRLCRRVRLSYRSLVLTTDVAIVRSTHAGTSMRSSTS
jgi:hypothetical protein